MPEIVGREAELAEIRAFIDAVAKGPHALVVEGEAGIGKTTVWESAISRAERNWVTSSRSIPDSTSISSSGEPLSIAFSATGMTGPSSSPAGFKPV